MFSRERKTAARPTAALDNQESNLRAARKSLINAPFARCNGFILRVVFHSEMCSTARRRTLRCFPSVQSRNTPCERVPRTPQARQIRCEVRNARDHYYDGNQRAAANCLEVLVDFRAHAQWNPFVPGIEGFPREGETTSVYSASRR